jgi:multiple sugar transport system permease protein
LEEQYSDRINITRSERWTSTSLFTIIGILIIVFGILPISELLFWSFTNKPIGEGGSIIGIKNYLDIFSSRDYYLVLKQTLVYTVPSVLMKLLIGSSLAMITAKLVMNSSEKILKWIIPLLLIPWVIPTAASMLIWSWILYDLGGPLNSFLKSAGIINENIPWLGGHRIATICLIIVNVWRGTGFFFAAILAARLSIPKQIYFVSWIEGASNFSIFKAITLPSMLSTFMVVSLISIINTYTDFQVVHILTDGGPGDSTQIFSTMIYEYAFRGKSSLGYASAFAISMAPCLLITIIFLLRYIGKSKSRKNEIY